MRKEKVRVSTPTLERNVLYALQANYRLDRATGISLLRASLRRRAAMFALRPRRLRSLLWMLP